MDSFKRLRQVKAWKRRITAGWYAWGLTIDRRNRTYHAHIHIAADFIYWDKEELRAAWIKAGARSGLIPKLTENGLFVSTGISQCKDYDHLADELLKGTRGDWGRIKSYVERSRKNAEQLGEILEAFRNRAWIRRLGKVKPKEEKPKALCPRCREKLAKYNWECYSLSRDELDHSRVYGPFWADFYKRFVFEEVDNAESEPGEGAGRGAGGQEPGAGRGAGGSAPGEGAGIRRMLQLRLDCDLA